MSTQQQQQQFVTFIDPTSHSGLLNVPLSKTYPTKGREEWLCGMLNKDLSLCCLFQKGRCHAQDKCHQVHVVKEFMDALRSEQRRIVSCCRRHNDTASVAPNAIGFFVEHFAGIERVQVVDANTGCVCGGVLPLDSLGFTVGLQQLLEPAGTSELATAAANAGVSKEQGVFTVPARKVCRLHLRGACKYGKDCKNIHLCSRLGQDFLVPTTQRAVVAAAPAKTSPTMMTPCEQQRVNFWTARSTASAAPVANNSNSSFCSSRRSSTVSTVAAPTQQQQQQQRPVSPPPRALPSWSLGEMCHSMNNCFANNSNKKNHPNGSSLSFSSRSAMRLSGLVFDPLACLELSGTGKFGCAGQQQQQASAAVASNMMQLEMETSCRNPSTFGHSRW